MTLTYRGRQIDLVLLKKLASQGHKLKCPAEQLCVVNKDDHPEVVVVAAGGMYEVLAGTPTGGEQDIRLVSTMLLKKAQCFNEHVPKAANPAYNDGFNRLQERYRVEHQQQRQQR